MYRITFYGVMCLLLMMTGACNIRTDLYQYYWTMDVNSSLAFKKHVTDTDPVTGLPRKMVDRVGDYRYGGLLLTDDSDNVHGWDKNISFLFEDEARTNKAGVEMTETNRVASPRNAEIVSQLQTLMGTNADHYTEGNNRVYLWKDKPRKGQVVLLSQIRGDNYTISRLLMIKQSVVIPATGINVLDKLLRPLTAAKQP
ncbi:hypothetical protein [Chitinophaga qingshengii]|uniref:Lipoprotein n=1 Tax=Chitinophaga qingshengii TaxID=1569794 RepID=A0ABR7TIY6_9BACT|nr:hypothetical protein [Chitinophaga qingshengii]MBC9929442.1 hypothetical protein [Chitinophaga qingshengii]